MKSDVILSVVTPVYNGEKFIDDYFNSLLKQTYRKFEIVIINDGSTDQSKDKIEEYIQMCGLNIRLINQGNRGISYATYKGINNAKSKYIVLMDQDDIAAENRLEKIAEGFQNGAELIMSAYEIIDENNQSNKKIIEIPNYVNNDNILLETFKRNYFLGSAMAFKFKNDFEFDLLSGGVTDYDIAIKMLLNNYNFLYIPQPLLKYRIHTNNVSANYKKIRNNAIHILGKYEEKNLLEKLLSMRFSEMEIYTTLGVLALFKNKNENAYQFLKEAECLLPMEKNRIYLEIMFYLSVFYYRSENIAKSYEYLLRCTEVKLNPAVANNMGVIFILRSDFKAAKSWFQKAVKLNDDYLDADRNINLLNKKKRGKERFIFTERLLRSSLNHSKKNIIL